MDRMGRGKAEDRAWPGGREQPISDPAKREGEEPGIARAGAGGNAGGKGLGGALWHQAGTFGNVCGSNAVPRDLLPSGELDTDRGNRGARKTGSGTHGRAGREQERYLGISAVAGVSGEVKQRQRGAGGQAGCGRPEKAGGLGGGRVWRLSTGRCAINRAVVYHGAGLLCAADGQRTAGLQQPGENEGGL